MFSQLVLSVDVFIPFYLLSLGLSCVKSFVDVALLVHIVDYLTKYLIETLYVLHSVEIPIVFIMPDNLKPINSKLVSSVICRVYEGRRDAT